MELADWIEGYGRAWEEGDPEAVVALFTEDWNFQDGRLPPHEGWGSWGRG